VIKPHIGLTLNS